MLNLMPEFQIPEGTLGTRVAGGDRARPEQVSNPRRNVRNLDQTVPGRGVFITFQIPEGTLGTTWVQTSRPDSPGFQIPEGTLGTADQAEAYAKPFMFQIPEGTLGTGRA